MESILPAYSDPLFSLLLVAAIATIIAFVSYGWGVYRKQSEESRLMSLLEGIHTGECETDIENLPYDPSLSRSLRLLAVAHEKNGEYHKAIALYRYLVRHERDDSVRDQLLERLGFTYLYAGFLERSEHIFLELLRRKARNRSALQALALVYEKMCRFDKAAEIIEPLRELGEDTTLLEQYLVLCSLRYEMDTKTSGMIEKLDAMLSSSLVLYRHILDAMFQIDTAHAWKKVDSSRLETILDILWYLPSSQLDLDIITQDQTLLALYYGRGDIDKRPGYCGRLSLDLLVLARSEGFEEVGLTFSYLCRKCKHTFPMQFLRCPHCQSIGTLKVEENIAKSSPKTSDSLL